jgi:hypothetical protein
MEMHMTFTEFAAAYRAAFEAGMNYSPNEVGSTIFVEKMADLADAYPEHLARFEAEEDARYAASAVDEADEWELTRAALAEMEAEGHEFGHEFDETDLALGTE